MKEAMEAGKTVRGIKGPSPLVGLQHFDNVNSYTIDYMHCILLGIVKTILKYWSEVLKINFKEVEKRILKHRRPIEITRLPDKIAKFQQWKANQSRAFLLFFGYGTLKGLIPDHYFDHFIKLSEAIFILLQTKITQTEFELAESHLIEFCGKFTELYGENNVTFNVHLVLHIPKMILNAGPLFCFSLFPFESKNAQIVKFVQGGSKHIEEISNKLMIYQKGKRYLCHNFLFFL